MTFARHDWSYCTHRAPGRSVRWSAWMLLVALGQPVGSACILIVATLPAARPAAAFQQPGRQVSGVVRDSATGAPLQVAQVAVSDPQRIALTDASGSFALVGLPARRLALTVRLIGYAPETRMVDLTGGDDTVVVALAARVVELSGVDVEAASREEQALRAVRSTTTMTAEEVTRERGQTLGETIKHMPGVSVVQYGPSIAKPVVRGLHSHRIIVANQGVRQEGQQWGGEHAPEIDAFAAHEIEVIRGAGAVVYGSDALGGVVRVEPRPLPVGPGIGGAFELNAFSNNRQGAASLMLEAGGARLPVLGTTALRLRMSRRRAGDAATPQYNLRNTGFSEFDLSAAVGIRRDWGSSELLASRFDTDLGLFTGAHVGNFDDLQRAMSEPPRPTLFSYGVGRPNQRVTHDALVWRTDLVVGSQALLEVDYGFQFNQRRGRG